MPRYPYSQKVARACRWCSKPVAKGRRFYSSQECQEAYYENRIWRFARTEALRRQRQCGICQKETGLEVHHIKPLPDRSYYIKHSEFHDQGNLLVLCAEHHEEAGKANRRHTDKAGPSQSAQVPLFVYAEKGET